MPNSPTAPKNEEGCLPLILILPRTSPLPTLDAYPLGGPCTTYVLARLARLRCQATLGFVVGFGGGSGGLFLPLPPIVVKKNVEIDDDFEGEVEGRFGSGLELGDVGGDGDEFEPDDEEVELRGRGRIL